MASLELPSSVIYDHLSVSITQAWGRIGDINPHDGSIADVFFTNSWEQRGCIRIQNGMFSLSLCSHKERGVEISCGMSGCQWSRESSPMSNIRFSRTEFPHPGYQGETASSRGEYTDTKSRKAIARGVRIILKSQASSWSHSTTAPRSPRDDYQSPRKSGCSILTRIRVNTTCSSWHSSYTIMRNNSSSIHCTNSSIKEGVPSIHCTKSTRKSISVTLLEWVSEVLPEYPIACNWAMCINVITGDNGSYSFSVRGKWIWIASQYQNCEPVKHVTTFISNPKYATITNVCDSFWLWKDGLLELMQFPPRWEISPTYIAIGQILLPGLPHVFQEIGIYQFGREPWTGRGGSFMGVNFITDGVGFNIDDVLKDLRILLNRIYFWVPPVIWEDVSLLKNQATRSRSRREDAQGISSETDTRWRETTLISHETSVSLETGETYTIRSIDINTLLTTFLF